MSDEDQTRGEEQVRAMRLVAELSPLELADVMGGAFARLIGIYGLEEARGIVIGLVDEVARAVAGRRPS